LRRVIYLSIWALFGLLTHPAAAQTSRPTVEDDVLSQIKSHPVNGHTLGDLHANDEFLRRVADRMIRETYQAKYHVVVRDSDFGGPTTVPSSSPPAQQPVNVLSFRVPSRVTAVAAIVVLVLVLAAVWKSRRRRNRKIPKARPLILLISLLPATSPSAVHAQGRFEPIVVSPQIDPQIIARRLAMPECFPPMRGFRASILADAAQNRPISLPSDASPEIRRAAEFVTKRLAYDGLVETTLNVMEVFGPQEFANLSAEKQLRMLEAVGVPHDLLSRYRTGGGFPNSSQLSVPLLATALAKPDGRTSIKLWTTVIDSNRGGSRLSNHRFQVATESGEVEIGAVRLQLTRGDDWVGEGDGGSMDIARQLVESLPTAVFLVSIQAEHLNRFRKTSSDWPVSDSAETSGSFTLISERFPITQWVQDNGKAGVIPGDSASPETIATLAPRYASRREEGSLFIPGDSFAMDGLVAAGHHVVQSPLLFQGGNLLAVRDPKTGQRILLIGEAEVYRNIALGLSNNDVIAAFRDEFGVDECRVLPAVSFHIDYDLTVRAVDDTLVAFVCDTEAGVKLALHAGVEALAAHGYLDAPTAAAAKSAIDQNRPDDFLKLLGPVLAGKVNQAGHFPESFANAFSTAPVDSGIGNLRLFLVAMDIFAHRVAKSSNPHTQAYLRSFERLADDQRRLRELLTAWGWKVVPVPSFGDGDRAINTINGIHDRTRYFMPAVGGLYSRVDDAAAAIFRREMGPGVEVIPIRCAESQRRAGALHCSASVYPKLNP